MPAHKPEELDELFVQALHSGDLDALVALYEPHACMSPEPGQVVTGTQSIREALSNFLAAKPQLTVETKTVNQSSDIALVISNWHLTATGRDGNSMDISGQAVVVSRRQPDGHWLMVIDNPFSLGEDR